MKKTCQEKFSKQLKKLRLIKKDYNRLFKLISFAIKIKVNS